MKRINLMASFLAVLVAFSTNAATVSLEQAKSAARAWASSGTALNAKFGSSVSSAVTHTNANGDKYHEVKFAGGGTLFLSSDTESEPVIAFTSDSNPDLSEGSPLRDLLDQDAKIRAAYRAAQATAVTSTANSRMTAASAAPTATTAANALWSELIAAGQENKPAIATVGMTMASSSIAPVGSVSDVRVAPLLKTQWDQSTASGGKCYNYYTIESAVCGCTATALSQIMYYWQFPNASVTVAPKTFACEFNETATNLTTMGGPYEWDKMVAKPANGITEDGRKAIGRLCADAGVAIGSSYTTTSSGTGAYAHDVPNAMRTYFGYKNGFDFSCNSTKMVGSGSLGQEENRAKIIYTNLDAKRPVQLGIYASKGGGHSVVADGYGYNTVNGKKTSFVHINMGWSGQDDMWYNLPEVNTSLTPTGSSGDTNYDLLRDVVFNVSTNSTGFELVSGCLKDDDGEKVANAKIRLTSETGDAVYETTSDANGVFALEVAGSKKYSVYAEKGLYFYASEEAEPVSVGETKATGGVIETSYNKYVIFDDMSSVGNRYLGDLDMMLPAARIIVDGGAKTNFYSRLEKALAKAADGDKIEILQPIELRESFTITNAITITTTNAIASMTPVQPTDGARLLVSNQLTLLNIAFDGAVAPAVEVTADTGKLILKGTDGAIDFGIRAVDAAAVKVCGTNSLVIASTNFFSFAVDCAAARKRGEQFGLLDGSLVCDSAVSNELARIVNGYDQYGEMRAALDASGTKLVWQSRPVPLADAVAYYITADGKTNTFARLDRAIENFEEALSRGDFGMLVPQIVVLKDYTLSRPLNIAGEVVLVGEGTVTITSESTAGFAITNGCLTVKNLTFDGYRGNALFYVNGGCLAMDRVNLLNLEGTNKWSGAITVMSGLAAITNCTIVGCKASGKYKENYDPKESRGGAVYLNGVGTELEIIDSRIVDCSANGLGGGVFACGKSKISIGGNLEVRNNNGSYNGAEFVDGFLLNSESVILKVVKPLSGVDDVVSVRYSSICSNGNKDGFEFADISAIMDDEDGVYNTRYSLYNAANVGFGVERVSETTLAWSAADAFNRVNSDGSFKLEVADDNRRGQYKKLSHAFAAVTNASESAVITVLKSYTNNDSIAVIGSVVLKSKDNDNYTIYRNAEVSIAIAAGSELTITNLVFEDVKTISNSAPMLAVDGGELTLDADAKICNINGTSRNATAVSVWDGGMVTMLDGSEISNCSNHYHKADADVINCGRGGGIIADNGMINLYGGVIKNCYAQYGGAIFAGSKSVVKVAGDFVASGNTDGYRGSKRTSNLYVSDNSTIELVGAYEGNLGVISGYDCDTNIFGTVTVGFADLTTLTNSAAHFHNDITGGFGVPITNATASVTQLVWSTSLDANGVFVGTDGVSYYPLAVVNNLLPTGIAFKSIVLTGSECTVTLTNLVKGCHYTIFTNGVLNAKFPNKWTAVEPEFTAEANGPYTLTVPYSGRPIYFGATAR